MRVTVAPTEARIYFFVGLGENYPSYRGPMALDDWDRVLWKVHWMYIPCSDRFDWQLVTTPRHWVELGTLHKLNFKGLVGLRRNGHYMYLQRSCGSDPPPPPPIDAAKFIRYLCYGGAYM